jgi:hypothetical protein
MKKLAKKPTKKVSAKKKVTKTKRKPNPIKDVIKLTPSNLKKYGERLLGRHNKNTLEDLIKVYTKNKFKMSYPDDYDYDYDDDYTENDSYKAITAFDKVLDNYGVEIIRGKNPEDLIVYSNNGDSYAFTILYYKKKWYIGGIADILEENPSQY